jgi:hypothetical protein
MNTKDSTAVSRKMQIFENITLIRSKSQAGYTHWESNSCTPGQTSATNKPWTNTTDRDATIKTNKVQNR